MQAINQSTNQVESGSSDTSSDNGSVNPPAFQLNPNNEMLTITNPLYAQVNMAGDGYSTAWQMGMMTEFTEVFEAGTVGLNQAMMAVSDNPVMVENIQSLTVNFEHGLVSEEYVAKKRKLEEEEEDMLSRSYADAVRFQLVLKKMKTVFRAALIRLAHDIDPVDVQIVLNGTKTGSSRKTYY